MHHFVVSFFWFYSFFSNFFSSGSASILASSSTTICFTSSLCLWSSSNGTVMFSNSQGLKTNVQFNSLGVDTIKVRFLSRCGVEGSLSLPVSIGSPTGLTPHQEATFVVYPNPTTGRVKVAGLTIGEKIRIYNASSVLVDIYTVTDDEMLIDLSNLASGIYYLRTETKTSTIIKN